MEETKQVHTFEVDFKCPNCDAGYLRPTGTVLCSYPPIYPHKCNNITCDYVENFRVNYPHIIHKYVSIKKLSK